LALKFILYIADKRKLPPL